MMNVHGKYKGAIEKITITDATFNKSLNPIFEPTLINYLYGNNGTGKSTIARAINAGTGLDWRSGQDPTGFIPRVFSRDFVKLELKFNDDDPTMPGVLTLGEEFIKAQGSIAEKQERLTDLLGDTEKATIFLSNLRNRKESLWTRLVDNCWDSKGKEYKATFGGGGDFSTKEKFTKKVISTSAVQHDLADLKKRYKTVTDSTAKKYSPLSPLDLSHLDNAETFQLLGEAIISTSDSQFNRFMQTLDAVSWVKQGYENYLHKSDGKCPYCQQHLRADFENDISECFDGKYSNDCKKVATFQTQYAEYSAAFISIIKQHIESLKGFAHSFGNIAEFEKHLALLEKVVSANNQILATKVSIPSKILTIDSISPHLEPLNALIIEVNNQIANNNTALDNRIREQNSCMVAVWELLAYELKSAIHQYGVDDKELDVTIANQVALIGAQQSPISTLKSEIAQLLKKLGGSAPTIELVNNLLKQVGFRGFSLKAHPTVPDRYQVVRDDGSPAKLLSEGERNFIAFIYFYNLVKGSWKTEDLLKGKIVVIDDPVSSMDSGVLSIVASLVRELIDDCFLDGTGYNIKQIFILTHNPYFHNAVSQQMLRPDEAYFKKIAFFEIKKSDSNISTISKPCIQKSSSKDADIEFENVTPVLNAYSALWQEYKDAKHPSTLLHIINRIVDYHFIQLCSFDHEQLQSQILSLVGSDQTMLSLINEMLYHVYEKTMTEDSVGAEIYYPAVNNVADYRAALRKVFAAMGQESHYSKMSGEGGTSQKIF